MKKDNSITKHFGENLARLLSDKILKVYNFFPQKTYIKAIRQKSTDLTYSDRIELHADELKKGLPENFKEATFIILSILGDENKNETGMFSKFYWIMPLGKFIEKYGLDYFNTSIKAIEEITKRNTGEYAIRPFIRKYPDKSLAKMKKWAQSDNFHLRRLASEGLRP
jgi:hypothetical protein